MPKQTSKYSENDMRIGTACNKKHWKKQRLLRESNQTQIDPDSS
jgi:hypothetical protein